MPTQRNIKLNKSPHPTEIIISEKVLLPLINTPLTPAANQVTPILDKNSAISCLAL